MNREDFVHLHVHSEYSLLDGACRIQSLVEHVREMGQTAVAVTDHGNLYAAIQFYDAAQKAGIHPVIGCEVYLAQRTRFDREPTLDGRSYHLLLLCENNRGYQNLVKLVSLSHLEGFYKKPRVDLDLLRQYHEGLICLSGCIAGEIPRLLIAGEYAAARKAALRYREIFGAENFFLEIQNHGIAEEQQVLPQLIRLSQETGIPLAATNDAHYIARSDAQMQKVLLCIQTGKTLDQPNGMGFSTNEFYLKSTQEMAALFADVPEAVTNTAKIAARCQVTFRFGELKLPRFTQDGVQDNTAYFRMLCEKGMYKRYGADPSPEVRQRLKYELDVIISMGFVDYFLIVWDFIRYARSQDIPVGPGRGSGAGSLCAYCIGITQIDPIAGKLFFERFLNPERKNMPDFDIDFCIEGRPKVKEYVVRRYGSDHVAEIIAFDTLKARAAIRDAGRVLSVPYALCDSAAKLIDWRMSIAEALEEEPELRTMYDSNPQVHQLIEIARQIEGMPRHASTHAAGVVIAPMPLGEYVPLQKNDETVVTQYTMTELDRLGLLKMDFLGLRNLTIIRDAERSVSRHTPGFSVQSIPLDDPAVYQMIARGETSGVFQLESAGMRSFLVRLKPEHMEDIIAALALYRPGPMDAIPSYIQNRHDRRNIRYLHPMLREILEVTYGCIVYQEQVMQICQKMAGYSLGRADTVRRNMSKKKQAEMVKEREIFLHGSGMDDGCIGAVANGVPEETANRIFDQMESFASYAFNKSHAAAYALLAYQTAYLKCHYFGDYMAALMTSVIGDTPKLLAYMEACRSAGIPVCPPDVNTGEWSFAYREGKLFFGLLAIKGIGKSLTDQLTTERRKHGKFRGFVDFCRRMSAHGMNKRNLESLIRSGALDCLDCNRRQMLLHFEQVMEAVSGSGEPEMEGQMSLFGDVETSIAGDLQIPPAENYDLYQLLQMEKDVTGMYISGHPLDGLQWLWKLWHCQNLEELEQMPDKASVRVLCIVQEVKRHRTKKGEEMAFLTLEDISGNCEALVFPQLYSVTTARLRQGMILCISGKIFRKDTRISLICESIRTQEEIPQMLWQMQLCVKYAPRTDRAILPAFRTLCERFPGETKVIFYLLDRGAYTEMRQPLFVEISGRFYEQLCRTIPSPEKFGLIPAITPKKAKHSPH